MQAIIVSESFGDLLAVTLPPNRRYFDEVLIVTSPRDEETIAVAVANHCRYLTTNSFWDNGADFNKFKCIEQALDGTRTRQGWLAFLDADVIWPTTITVTTVDGIASTVTTADMLRQLDKERLYSFRRRRLLLDTTAEIPPEDKWKDLPLDPQYSECMGFTQIFHCDASSLGNPPWHPLHLTHAALGDSYFQDKWDLALKTWLDGEVLHLGRYGANWCGRVERRRDGTMPDKAEESLTKVNNLTHDLWGR